MESIDPKFSRIFIKIIHLTVERRSGEMKFFVMKLAIFKNRDFRFYVSSRFLMTMAWQGQAVAVAWQVYSLTKDPLSLGLLGLIEVIPAVGFALIAGHIVDRSERKKIVMLSQWLIICVSFVLWFLSAKSGGMNQSINLFLIYSCVFLLGAGRAFLGTAQFAFFGQIFKREDYVIASTWVSAAWQVAASLGPALGGIIYGQWGAPVTFFFCSVLICMASLSTGLIPGRGKIENVSEESFTESLFSGVRFVMKTKVILSALSLDLFAVFFGGAVALLPIFADRLGVGPEGLGMLRAAPFLGAVVMALWLTQRPPHKNVGKLMLTSVFGFGVCMICFALSTSFFWSFFILAISGGLDAVSVVVRSAILQLETPDHMRGRIAAVNSIFINSSNELGAFESGVAAKWMGVIPSVLFGGAMTLAVVFTTALTSPELRRFSFRKSVTKP
ncbi:MAG: transporter [Bacteriovoracaceae bacterium]|nr:transporter [Bacteriovoracaceae bacterium]